MDLFEYQAKELFAKHGVPVTAAARSATTADAARQAAPQIGRTVVVKAQVKTGGRGKAGGVKLADSPDEAPETRRATSSAWTSRATSSTGCSSPGSRHRRGVLRLVPARPGQPHLPRDGQRRGRHGDRGGRGARGPRRWRRSRSTRSTGVDAGEGAEIVDGRRLPADVRRARSSTSCSSCGGSSSRRTPRSSRSTRWCRRPTGQVLALDGKVTLDDNADFRHPDARRASSSATRPTRSSCAAKEKDLNYVKLDGEVGIIGNGAGLVMSTLDVVAYAGEEFGGVKPANFLDIGGGASAEVMANGLEIILSDPQVKAVFVNVFGGITVLRRGRQRHRAGVRAAGRAGATPVDQADRRAASTATTPTRVGASSTRPSTTSIELVDTMDGAARRVAELAAAARLGGRAMAIWLNETAASSCRASPAPRAPSTPAAWWRPVPQIVAGVTPGKGGQTVDVDGRHPGLRLGRRGGGRDRRRRVRRLRAAAVRQGRRGRGRRRRRPAVRGHHRGRPGRTTPRSSSSTRRTPGTTRIIGPNCPGHHQPGQVQRRHHPGRHHRGRPHRPGQQVAAR